MTKKIYKEFLFSEASLGSNKTQILHFFSTTQTALYYVYTVVWKGIQKEMMKQKSYWISSSFLRKHSKERFFLKNNIEPL